MLEMLWKSKTKFYHNASVEEIKEMIIRIQTQKGRLTIPQGLYTFIG